MRYHLTLGSTPGDEDCAQVGDPDYQIKATEECTRYKKQLLKQFGPPPEDCAFGIKAFPHDFGSYYEVVIYYNDANQKSMDYAFNVENNLPANWE